MSIKKCSGKQLLWNLDKFKHLWTSLFLGKVADWICDVYTPPYMLITSILFLCFVKYLYALRNIHKWMLQISQHHSITDCFQFPTNTWSQVNEANHVCSFYLCCVWFCVVYITCLPNKLIINTTANSIILQLVLSIMH